MKKLHLFMAIALFILGTSVAQSKYASKETQEVIEKMGGIYIVQGFVPGHLETRSRLSLQPSGKPAYDLSLE